MTKNFEAIIKSFSESQNVIVGDQTFTNENICDDYLQCSLFSKITFFEIDFETIDFTGSNFINCKFKNCRLKEVIFRKCDAWNLIFENCKIERSDFTRSNFHDGVFRECKFVNVNLRASNFFNFEFIETNFENSNLELIGLQSLKIWKLNKCTEVENSSNINLGKFLETLNSND